MKLAADANVILAALGGGAAGRVLQDESVQVYAPQSVLDEIGEYIPRIAKLKGLDEGVLRMTLLNLPIISLDPEEYEAKRGEAFRRIGKRDPDDVDLLAVALTLTVPIWSNDNDFEDAGVEWYTTAEILKKLKPRNP